MDNNFLEEKVMGCNALVNTLMRNVESYRDNMEGSTDMIFKRIEKIEDDIRAIFRKLQALDSKIMLMENREMK